MTDQDERRALVVGAGIGGLAAALALARAGWQVDVHEKAKRFDEVGAGLQMSPNACRVLRWLGVLDAVAAVSVRPETAEMRDGQTGATIYSMRLGDVAEARWGAPYLHIHRADLHRVLREAAVEAGAALHPDSVATTYGNRPEGVRLHLASGEVRTADMVIAADGLRSVLRGVMNGAEEPEFSGQIAWRGIIPSADLPSGMVRDGATVWAGPGRHLVTYRLRGGEIVNYVAVEESREWTAESWQVAGDPDRLRAGFANWHPDVCGLLERVENPYVWGLFLRPEQVRWCDGRVALLGDSAHAMLPFMAQGAAMALEDVAELMRTLDIAPDIPSALRVYEDERWPRVARVQAQSRTNGLLFHKRTELGRLVSWAPISMMGWLAPGLAAGRLDWLYGHDVTRWAS